MSGATEGSPLDRLKAALDAIDEMGDVDGGGDLESFLGEHEDLRDTLESVIDAKRDGGDGERRIGDYRVVREIGRGGMGVVYEARQLSLDRPVALKLLSHELSQFPTAVARFRREATLAAGLEHPSIAKVFGFTADDSGHYLVMELVPGAPLDAVLRELTPDADAGDLQAAVLSHRVRSKSAASDTSTVGAWDGSYEQIVVRWVVHIADALETAHAAGIIHRDVKPGNILVRGDGVAVLTDFGLAREAGMIGVTMTGEIAGTPAYQSPEQIEAKSRDLGAGTDVFSLGATLYELLTQQRAFAGESILDVQRNVVDSDPREPSKVNPKIDRDLTAIVLKALEKKPRHRYASCGAFASDLRNWLGARPVTARRVSRVVRLLRWCQRNPWAAGLFAVLSVFSVVSLLLWREAASNERMYDWLSVGFKVDDYLEEVLRAPATRPENVDRLQALLDKGLPYVEQLSVAQANVDTLQARSELADFSRADQHLLDSTRASLQQLLHLKNDVIADLEARIDRARRADDSVETHRAKWDEAIAELAANKIQLEPQLDLVPLRRDPHSRLWEFWHTQSGVRPELGANDRWRVDRDTGVVFVLVPPGEFLMGCQRDDPNGDNFDPHTSKIDGPAHWVDEITEPYFLSKYELSRGQWSRLLPRGRTMRDSSLLDIDDPDNADMYPVRGESAERALAVLGNHGLTLPTEAQWEFAARAGGTTLWTTGDDVASLDGYANVLDQAAWKNQAKREGRINLKLHLEYAPFDDGYVTLAPVGAFKPNRWGFHQMHGNLAELCLGYEDGEGFYEVVHRVGDGAIMDPGDDGRFSPRRGGGYHEALRMSRSAARYSQGYRRASRGATLRIARRVYRRDR